MRNLFNLFRSKERDRIGFDTIQIGTILKVYPASRSHVYKPYLVKVVDSCIDGFTTELVYPMEVKNPRTHKFIYLSGDWIDYHCDRFQIKRGMVKITN